jgi:predicted nucleic acid-binding protein
MSAQYLLDTNICIYIAKHNPPRVREHFLRHAANEMAMSVIMLGELRVGAEKSQSRDKGMAVIQEFGALVYPLPPRAARSGWRALRSNSSRPAKGRHRDRQQRPLAGGSCAGRGMDPRDQQHA